MIEQPLTDTEERLLRFIDDHVLAHGYCPPMRAMAAQLGCSTSQVQRDFASLKAQGRVEVLARYASIVAVTA